MRCRELFPATFDQMFGSFLSDPLGKHLCVHVISVNQPSRTSNSMLFHVHGLFFTEMTLENQFSPQTVRGSSRVFCEDSHHPRNLHGRRTFGGSSLPLPPGCNCDCLNGPLQGIQDKHIQDDTKHPYAYAAFIRISSVSIIRSKRM